MRIAVWLPLTGWNGRFQGTGGGGYAAGLFEWALAPAVRNGYAAASTDAGVGTRHGVPFPIADTWITYFLQRDPGFGTSTVGLDEFERLFRRSRAEYRAVLGTDDPDLSTFRDAGGKMITWHGLADPLIPPQGTVDYRRRVEAVMGGGRAPDPLPAATTNAQGQRVTRNLCRYPLVSRYLGHGDPNSASSHTCVRPGRTR